MPIRRVSTMALMTAAVLVAAACGSTVPIEEQQAAEAAAAQGVDGSFGAPGSADGVGGTGSGTGIGGSGSGVAGTGTSSGAGSSTGGPGSGPGTTGGGKVASGAMGPGITSDEIKLGFAYLSDGDEVNTALGGSGATTIDFRRAYNGMVDWVNARGGIAGRKVVPVHHTLQATSNETQDQQDQEVCTHFTEDDPVFAANAGWKTENGISCLEKGGIVIVESNGLVFKSNGFFERHPYYIEFDGIDNDDIATMYADTLAQQKYFSKNASLGLITWDHPEYAGPLQQTLIPRLRQHGVRPADVAYVKYPTSQNDYGEMAAQIGNAAVRFKSEGITHVMMMDQGALIALFFMQAAERQQYRPRYGLTSASGGTTLAGLLRASGDNDARNQLRGSVGVGWVPTIDVAPDDVPGWAQTKSRELCYSIMDKNGVAMTSANARAQAELVCNTLWTMDATISAAGNVINQGTFIAGLDRVGDLDLTTGTGLALSSARHDGNRLAARMKFVDQCVCFRYTTGPFAVPD